MIKQLKNFLFEDESDEIIEVDRPINNIENNKRKIVKIIDQKPKEEKPKTILTLNELTPKPTRTTTKLRYQRTNYKLQEPISPIFGSSKRSLSDENTKQVLSYNKESSNAKPIISPIKGTVKDNQNQEISNIKKLVSSEKIEVSDIKPLNEKEIDEIFLKEKEEDFLDSVITKDIINHEDLNLFNFDNEDK